ncbi:MAG: hypothetical protein JSR58_05365 [Verrucomicrobia bacterium]|nr:hypothetical protein [Verrucomicrobiota bacterium]
MNEKDLIMIRVFGTGLLLAVAGGFLVGKGVDNLTEIASNHFKKPQSATVSLKRFAYSILSGYGPYELLVANKALSLLLQRSVISALFFMPLIEQVLIHSCIGVFCLIILVKGIIDEARAANPNTGWSQGLVGVWFGLHLSLIFGPAGYFLGAQIASQKKTRPPESTIITEPNAGAKGG